MPTHYYPTIFDSLEAKSPPSEGGAIRLQQGAKAEGSSWYCLRTQLKREVLAAKALRERGVEEIFNPRLRFQRSTKRGLVWYEESLFPGYLFARFREAELRMVGGAPGVVGPVQFGSRVAVVANGVIHDLRSRFSEDTIVVGALPLKSGDTVRVVEGVFIDLEVLVNQYRPGKERVKILFDFLGRVVEAEISAHKLKSLVPPVQMISKDLGLSSTQQAL